MPLGLLDLHLVTDRLITQLNACTANSKMWDDDTTTPPRNPKFSVRYTGLSPDAAREDKDEADCQVSVYLFHVTPDKFHRNTFPLGGPAQTNASQPFALTLYYLVTAWAKASFRYEQQAMSIALKCFHEKPSLSVTDPIDKREEGFTLTIEPQTVDEITRLWQAINLPLRLSAIYRVGVIFLEAPVPEVAGVVRHAPEFVDPRGVRALDDDEVHEPTLPGAPGLAKTDRTGLATIEVDGARFDADPTATEVKIRARSLTRSIDPPLSGQFRVTGQAKLELRVPLYTPQGRYLLRVQPPLPDKPIADFWLEVPERIALVETDPAGLATIIIDDAGFASVVTTVHLDNPPGTLLAETATDPPAAGQFCVVDKETLRVRVPATGRHLLTLGRGPDELPLALWLKVP
jgi:hypothetical protein